ncbi:LamG-like jellyroll fold domain-containing protein [Haloarcula marina]|uniref:LamG-like jellyroll fold domain-containing protein n=1 Tax=Haloarcula marina TaxID=2961574 RepID=UPI0020B676CD|nr:LamG-like jellyroll fold domain-containing protein [Halomicroarcula marina]
MTEVREAAADLLESRPATEDALREILAVDSDGPWEFGDIDVDSGTFGEIVSTGIVEKGDDGYRVADRAALRSALDGEPEPGDSSTRPDPSAVLDDLDLSISRTAGAALAGVLLVLALVRILLPMGSVYRNGDIVLASNDPYLYRYWGEELLRRSLPAFDPTALASLPTDLLTHDTLMVVTTWWAAAALGGTDRAVGTVLAWYPVVAGLVSAVFVYLLTVRVSRDRRAGIAAVAILAVTPVHAYRTMLGFGDHHAFDYIWIALTAYSLVVLSTQRLDRTAPRLGVSTTGWLAAGAVALGVTAQVTSWRGGPLLLLPIGLYAVAQSLTDVDADRSPLAEHGLLAAALAVGGVLSLAVHLGFGWMALYRALAPALLAGGTLVVLLAGEGARRAELSAAQTLAAEVGVGLLTVAVAWVAIPTVSEGVTLFVDYMQRFNNSGIAEASSLFAEASGSVLGPFLLFGFTLLVALPAMVWGPLVGYRDRKAPWLVLSSYVWLLMGLALIQVRFAGQLSLFAAVFAGVGFLRLAAWIDLARPPLSLADGTSSEEIRELVMPDRQTAAYVVVLFLLVGSLGMVQTPVKMEQLSTDESTYEMATWIDGHAEAADRTYPGNYVFNQWGQNRVYNYFVSGQSREYGFALRNYPQFLVETDPEAATEMLTAGRRGYVITEARNGFGPATMQSRLHDRLGSAGNGSSGASHYRAVNISDGGATKVFEVVPGATVRAAGPANETVTVATPVTVSGETFTYERQVRTNATGDVLVDVPYTGQYATPGGNVTVGESAVRNGTGVGPYEAHYAFESLDDGTAEDYIGGHHAEIRGGSAIDGPRGTALSLDGSAGDYVPLEGDRVEFTGSESFTVCSWARVDDREGSARQDIVHLGNFEVILGYNADNDRWLTYFQTDEEPAVVSTPAETPTEWTHLCGRYDGEELTLWVDGERRGSTAISGPVVDSPGDGAIGAHSETERLFGGDIDDVHLYDDARSPAEIRQLYEYGANASE